jgi:hypothetical protein
MLSGVPQGRVLGTTSCQCFHKWLVWCGQVFKLYSICKWCQNISRNKIPYDRWLLKSNILVNSVRLRCISICVKLNINKTRAISFRRKTNWHGFDYKLCESSIRCTDCIRDLGALMDTKLHFHEQVDNIFSQSIRLLGLIQTVTFSFLSLHNLLMLYCSLVSPKLDYCLCCVEFCHFFRRL